MRCTPSTTQVVALVCAALVTGAAVTPCHAVATKNSTVLSTERSRTYAKVRVLQVDPNGVIIRHKDGIAKVLFDDLSDADRRRFKYNRVKADEFVRKHGGPPPVATPVAEKKAGNETTVNLNITLSQAPRTQLVWTVPYPYYRYPQTRGLVRPACLRTNVIRPWYPYNTFSYQWRHGVAGCGFGHPFLMLGGYGCAPPSVYGHAPLPAFAPWYSMVDWRRRSWCDLFRHTNWLHHRPFSFGPFTYPRCL